jgi:lipase chaperone LimK
MNNTQMNYESFMSALAEKDKEIERLRSLLTRSGLIATLQENDNLKAQLAAERGRIQAVIDAYSAYWKAVRDMLEHPDHSTSMEFGAWRKLEDELKALAAKEREKEEKK